MYAWRLNESGIIKSWKLSAILFAYLSNFDKQDLSEIAEGIQGYIWTETYRMGS